MVEDLGRMRYSDAFRIQSDLAAERKQGRGVDHLLFVEHPHVITIGRNGHEENILIRDGLEIHESDRGGDVTYHGPGQIVAYPVIDLRLWKRDVGAFVRAIEQVLIDTLADYGIASRRIAGMTGVWTSLPTTTSAGGARAAGDLVAGGFSDAKIAAIGVHLSRWVSTHGWALNVTTDLRYFQNIVPCGLTKPVTSMEALGVHAGPEDVKRTLAHHFGKIFDFEMQAEPAMESAHTANAPLCAQGALYA